MRYNKYEKQGACHWKEYARGRNYKEIVDSSLIPFLKRDLKKGTVVDIGCGDGLPTCKLAGLGFITIGVDVSELGIKYARHHCNKEVEWVPEDVIDFLGDCIVDNRTFDYLYSLNTIEHLEDAKVLVELCKRIKNFSIIVTDDKDTCKKDNPFHVKELNRDDFKELFYEFNLEEIQINHPKFFGYKIKYEKCTSNN